MPALLRCVGISICYTRQVAHCLSPIFTLSEELSLIPKAGVDLSVYAIAYSFGQYSQLLKGDKALQKEPAICIVMKDKERLLPVVSRILFILHHPIQYNFEVKEVGYVHADHMSRFLDCSERKARRRR